MNTPAPGAPQTSHKAWAGALAAMAAAAVQFAVSGEAPSLDSVATWGSTLGSAALVALFVYFVPNKPK